MSSFSDVSRPPSREESAAAPGSAASRATLVRLRGRERVVVRAFDPLRAPVRAARVALPLAGRRAVLRVVLRVVPVLRVVRPRAVRPRPLAPVRVPVVRPADRPPERLVEEPLPFALRLVERAAERPARAPPLEAERPAREPLERRPDRLPGLETLTSRLSM
jgi:hypothetical protein